MEKSIYFWFSTDRRRLHSTEKKSMWYKLNPAQLYSPESELTLVSKTNLNEAAAAVAWESTIYVLGGNIFNKPNGTREVYYLDTRRPDLGWKVGPALISPRTEVSTAVKGGKIYAFGGVEADDREKANMFGRPVRYYHGLNNKDWGEVFDPLVLVNTTRRSIAGPGHKTQLKPKSDLEPDYEDAIGVLYYDEDRRYSDSNLYEPESDTWKEMVPWGYKSAIVDDMVYYYVDSHVCAYDMKGRINFDIRETAMGLDGQGAAPLAEEGWEHPAFLVHVGGGRLCLLWESTQGMHCLKFRVSVHYDDHGEVALLATVEACRVFSNYEHRMKRADDSRNLKCCLVA